MEQPPLLVTKTYLPPLEEYVAHLRDIWEAGQVTNIGAKTRALEAALADYLGVKHVLLVTNGAVALQLAIRALGLRGSIVTTPFSYAATANSILWEHCTPLFADIDEATCCMDPERAADLIRSDTSALLPVHVYGNACAHEELSTLARSRGLKLVYDAAHTFGSRLDDRAVSSLGDVSILSFHATKLFHTVEGGALVTDDPDLYHRLDWMHTFGHQADTYFGIGINGKTSELHAAMGLCNLPRTGTFIAHRKAASAVYDRLLFPSARMRKPDLHTGLTFNYAYYPVIFEDQPLCEKVIGALQQRQIFPRRYFYPSLNTLPHTGGGACPVSESISRRVLCLPLSATIGQDDLERTAGIIREACT